MKTLSATEKLVSQLIQKDIELVSRPFSVIAKSCCITEQSTLNIIKNLIVRGFIRKFGAVLRQQKAGYRKNALVVWAVPLEQITSSGEKMAQLDFISHCYERNPAFAGRYSLFTMLHAKDESINFLVDKISAATGIRDFLILESVEEYKKISPEYFS